MRLGGAILPMTHVISILASLAALLIFYFWLEYSKLGLIFRALADNAREAALRGYNVSLLRVLAFALSGLLTGVASLLEAQAVSFDTFGGLDALLVAVTAAIIGGGTSLLGPVIAAF